MKRRDFLRRLGGSSMAPVLGGWMSSAKADTPIRPPRIATGIEPAETTTPMPGTEVFAMLQPGPRTDTRTAVANSGDTYVGGGGYLWKSIDQGETWNIRKLPQRSAGGFGILKDDVFVLVADAPDHSTSFVLRSTDYGKTWSEPTALNIHPYDFSGGGWSHVYQRWDGTAMITVTLRHRDRPGFFHDHIFRSTDGGTTWGDRTLLVPYSAESSLLALRGSDRMLAYVRAQRTSLPEDPPDFWKRTGAPPGHPWPLKNGVVAESNDGGRTWDNLRLFDTYGSVPGALVGTPDGRVAAIWLQRYPYTDSEIRVRMSSDGGRTWQQRTYRLLKAHGYPSSVVYPDGTIVTVCENTRMDGSGHPRGRRTMATVRWRLPEKSPRK